jgi:hypothetical protein
VEAATGIGLGCSQRLGHAIGSSASAQWQLALDRSCLSSLCVFSGRGCARHRASTFSGLAVTRADSRTSSGEGRGARCTSSCPAPGCASCAACRRGRRCSLVGGNKSSWRRCFFRTAARSSAALLARSWSQRCVAGLLACATTQTSVDENVDPATTTAMGCPMATSGHPARDDEGAVGGEGARPAQCCNTVTSSRSSLCSPRGLALERKWSQFLAPFLSQFLGTC